MILTRWATNQGKSCQRNNAVHERLLRIERIVEKRINRFREVKPSAEDREDACPPKFQFLDGCYVMGVVSRDDVTSLQHEPDHRSLSCFVVEI